MPVAEYELYKRIKLLGEGSFGKAYLVECLSDGSFCVIKQVDLSKMSEQEKKDTLKEAKILEVLRHPNIVKFREVYKTKKGKLCIVMDYADGGDLSSKIKERRGQPMSENQILDWFTQICLALKHVHDRKIIHRDLKCQNIFLTKTGIVKLGDFGIARVLSNTRENAKTMVGTPYYLSPEIIENKPYSFKSDMWSIGVVLYELCALKPPFTADSLHFLALKIVRGSYNPIPSNFSKELKNLVASLLQTDPNKRPTTNNILAMPFIQARIKNFLTESVRVTEFSHTVLHKEKVNINNIKMDDLKNVINEAPMPDHLIKQLKQQQQQPQSKEQIQQQPKPQPQQLQKEGNDIRKQVEIENINQKPLMVHQKQNQKLMDQKPADLQNALVNKVEDKKIQQPFPQQNQQVFQQNYHFKQNPNQLQQKEMIIQNIIAKKEEEKQAQQLIMQQNQQIAKQNYHYKNRQQPKEQQPEVQQQKLQPQKSPLLNEKHIQPLDQKVQPGVIQSRHKEQVAQQQRNPEIVSPKLIRQQSDQRAEDKKFVAPQRLPIERKNLPIVQNQPDVVLNYNRPKWEQRGVLNQQPQTPSSQQRDRLEIKQDPNNRGPGVKPAIDKKPTTPQHNPVEFKTALEKKFVEPRRDERAVESGGAVFGAFINPNFIGNKNKKKKENNVKEAKMKVQELASKQNEQRQPLAKIDKQKNLIAKLAQDNLQKQEDERLKKERLEAGENSKKAEIDKKRSEKEKEREALRQQMQNDIQKKRNLKKQAVGGFDVIFCGGNFRQQDSDPSLTEKTEEIIEKQKPERKENNRSNKPETDLKIDNLVESGAKSASPDRQQPQRKVQWKIDVEAFRAKDKSPENENAKFNNHQPKGTSHNVEMIVEDSAGSDLSANDEGSSDKSSENSWNRPEEENNKLAEFYEEEKKRELQYDQIKKGLLDLNPFQKINDYVANKKDQEEIITYEALLKELSDIITEPNWLDNNNPNKSLKEDTNDTSDNEEDREDDIDEDSPKDLKKEACIEQNNLDFFISDYNKLEGLKVFMEDALGDEIFLKAYHIIKDLFHKKVNLEEIEKKYAKEDTYAILFPFMSRDLRDKYLPVMFTFVIMENIAEESPAG